MNQPPADSSQDSDAQPDPPSAEPPEGEQQLDDLIEEADQANQSEEIADLQEAIGNLDSDPDKTGVEKVEKNVKNLNRILKLKVPFQVVLSEKQSRMREVLGYQVGSLIEFEKLSDEHLDIYVHQQKFGFGEVVKMSEKFGVRIKGMIPLKEKIRRLGS